MGAEPGAKSRANNGVAARAPRLVRKERREVWMFMGVMVLFMQAFLGVDECPANGGEEIRGREEADIDGPVVVRGGEDERHDHGRDRPSGVAYHVHAAAERARVTPADIHAGAPRA